MKPIVHYRGLTRRYLLQHRKRSLLTLLGILLSVALLFASTVMGETLKNSYIQNIKDEQGNYHVAYLNVTKAQLQLLQANPTIEQIGEQIKLGDVRTELGTKLTIVGADSGYLDILGLKLTQGRLPQQPGELALEAEAAEQLPGKPKIGDRIHLSVQPPDAAGATGTKIEADFTLTGLFANKLASQQNRSSTGVITLDAARALAGDQVPLSVGVRFKPRLDLQKAIANTTAALGLDAKDAKINRALLTILGQSDDPSNNRAVTIGEAIVIGIILLASIAVIYNAFHISVLERIRQFGVLRSIGMTPRQIRIIVFGEASQLAAVGIPLGLLAGWGAIAIVMALFRHIGGSPVGFGMFIPWYVPVGTALLGLAAIYASAFGPVLAAGRVSPMTAILHSNRFTASKLSRRRHRLLGRLLGFTGRMAFDNLRRNKKRFRITLFSMCVGIVLYIFFSSFLSFVLLSGSRQFAKDYALVGSSNTEYTEADYEDLTQIPGVKRVYRVMIGSGQAELLPGKLTPAYSKAVHLDPLQSSKVGISAQLYGYQPQDLDLSRPRLVAGTLDASTMDRENGVVLSQKAQLPGEVTAVSRYQVGDTIELRVHADSGGFKSISLKVVGLVDKMPVQYDGGSEQFTLITTETMFARITGKAGDISRFDIVVDRNADQTAIKEALDKIAARHPDGFVMDFVSNGERSAVLMIGILLYGLVTVLSLISAINIIHTISANLILRTREFGTLRAVGMTMGQMRRMIMYESIGYGLLATLFGGTVGVLLSRWLYSKMNHVQGLPYHFPWQAVGISGLAAMAIGLLASRVPLRRLARMDVVQAIRAEE